MSPKPLLISFEEKPVIIQGDGTSLWTLTFNTDFAVGFVGLMGNPHAVGEAFQITSDESLSWDQIYYDPRDISEQKSCIVKDKRYTNGEYCAYFPSFFPDGDYYFFIEENFEFGYLGHPWRQEIWIFGYKLIEEIEKIYQELGWKKLK